MPSDQPLRFDVVQRDDWSVVKISGSATMDVSGHFKDSLFEAVSDPAQSIVLDLSDLDFLCSEGLGAMIAAYRECVHRGGSVRLARPTKPIQELLDVTKLSRLFPVYVSVEDAIKA